MAVFPTGAVLRLLGENGIFLEFSLCLSRACLGKIIHFIYKWLKKCRFLTSIALISFAAA